MKGREGLLHKDRGGEKKAKNRNKKFGLALMLAAAACCTAAARRLCHHSLFLFISVLCHFVAPHSKRSNEKLIDKSNSLGKNSLLLYFPFEINALKDNLPAKYLK